MKKENKQFSFDKIIYVSHPFCGNEKNIELIESKVKKLRETYPNYLFISPVHTFGYLYDKTTYEEGIDMCLRLLEKCDEVWIVSKYYENSKGCLIERSYAHSMGIPVFNVDIEV